MKTRLLLLSLTLLLLPITNSYALSVKSRHPNRYVVREGDTLWDIAEKFLDKPWEWRKLWHTNPQIKNPDLIYPGSVIEFRNNHGRPALYMVRRGTIRLSPQKRRENLHEAIPPVPLHLIRPFLNTSLVLDADYLKKAPYVVAYADKHLIGGANNHIYVNGIKAPYKQNYSIYRDNGIYRDPNTNEILGYAAMHIADARVIKTGTPATMALYNVKKGVAIGDRLLAKEKEEFTTDFLPQAPKYPINGEIISLFNGLTQVGSHYVVVINRGKRDGLRPGDVLTIEDVGETVPDPVGHTGQIKLPNEKTGELMIFRTFHTVSFGLVMKAIRTINIHDVVTNPT